MAADTGDGATTGTTAAISAVTTDASSRRVESRSSERCGIHPKARVDTEREREKLLTRPLRPGLTHSVGISRWRGDAQFDRDLATASAQRVRCGLPAGSKRRKSPTLLLATSKSARPAPTAAPARFVIPSAPTPRSAFAVPSMNWRRFSSFALMAEFMIFLRNVRFEAAETGKE